MEIMWTLKTPQTQKQFLVMNQHGPKREICCLRNNLDSAKIGECLIVFFILNSIIEDSKRRKCPLFVCYVDFRKAFDHVQHELLWLRLSQLGISNQMLHILQAMYTKASVRVKVSRREATESFPCKIGVRQGCVLSLFIGGLIPELAENHAGTMLNDEPLDVLMYADDIVLSHHVLRV